MRLNNGASLNIASVKNQLDWFKSEGLVKKNITIDTLVDQSYVKIIG
jgi:NitT/TauT family transport system substrate-binding protein